MILHAVNDHGFTLVHFCEKRYNKGWSTIRILTGGECVLAQVIVDIVNENVAHTFTYRITEGMSLSV